MNGRKGLQIIYPSFEDDLQASNTQRLVTMVQKQVQFFSVPLACQRKKIGPAHKKDTKHACYLVLLQTGVRHGLQTPVALLQLSKENDQKY
jgi:hypothetical protein